MPKDDGALVTPRRNSRAWLDRAQAAAALKQKNISRETVLLLFPKANKREVVPISPAEIG